MATPIEKIAEEMAGVRQDLHQNPATSYEEIYISNKICELLTAWGIKHERGIAVTGVVATIEGQKTDSGKAIGFRADIDALNIIEETKHNYPSKIKGKMHACGHDGHTATLLGAAKYLNETRNFNGKIHLLFQPAEEGGWGAGRMVQEGLFDKHPMQAVYGFHNWPWMKFGKAGVCAGGIFASVDEAYIAIKGRGGHAAVPENTIDPVVIGSHLVLALQTIVSRNVSPLQQAVVTIANFNGGTGADNIIADTAKLTATLRTYAPETRLRVEKRFHEIVKGVCETFGAEVEIDYRRLYDPTVNDPHHAAFVGEVLQDVLGAENVDVDCTPTMAAEDFGTFLQHKPGCYFFFGQGTEGGKTAHDEPLHSPRYDFNDKLLLPGIQFWARLAEKALPL
ncbi:MAG: amidohydrolase [Alphaproteobacteria bacterium]|nr:amidohydrolase [Alphaproteobacteria bacterium]